MATSGTESGPSSGPESGPEDAEVVEKGGILFIWKYSFLFHSKLVPDI